MTRFFGFVVAVIFSLVQVASLHHMAEHGFQKHLHQGKSCEFANFCVEKARHDAGPGFAFLRPVSLVFAEPRLDPLPIYGLIIHIPSSRAPPLIALL